jgi:hypothetical protein
MSGDGDGMLVDDRDGGASSAAAGNGEIDGTRLFGDEGGKYLNGYEKMKALDANGDGKLNGAELGVSEISLKMELTANDRGEINMRSTFTQNGEKHISEDVWFGEDADSDNLVATTARESQPVFRARRSIRCSLSSARPSASSTPLRGKQKTCTPAPPWRRDPGWPSWSTDSALRDGGAVVGRAPPPSLRTGPRRALLKPQRAC